MPTKRSVKRINPGRVDTFDDHLWPVVVALGVLSAIGLGAILTLLSGPVMWISLLALPAMTGAAMYFLSRTTDSLLRRALQFALIISLAVHLLILVIASLVLIFDSGQKTDWRQVTKREERKIEFSNRNKSVSIPVSKKDNAPEPDVEIRRDRTQVTSAEQPLPVPETMPTISPQTRRRESVQQTVPRFDKSLSELRRNRMMQEMQNSVAVKSPTPSEVPTPTASTASSNESGESPSPTAAAEADSISRSSAKKPKQTIRDANPQLATQSPTPQRKPLQSRQTQQTQNSRLTETPRRDSKAESQQRSAHARVQRKEVQIRKQVAKTKPRPAPPKSLAETTSEAKPAESAGQLTRRPQRSSIAATSDAPSPLSRKPDTKPLAAKLKRRTDPTRPSISRRQSDANKARLATNDAPKLQSMEPVSRPAENPKSSATTASVEPKTLSITKGVKGVAGGVDQPNLQTGQGGLPSPAVRPSDAMLSRRQQSPSSNDQRLTNTQASAVRRSLAQSPRPSSAFRADTVKVAKIAGSKTPALETMESAAADVTSASREAQATVAIEAGKAPVNLGPTKVVAGMQRRKLSGGGSPEVANLSPEQTKRSVAESETRPSLANAQVAPMAAPRSTEAALAAAELEEPTELADLQQRSEGSDSQQLDQNAAADVAAPSDEGNSTAMQRLANRSEVAGESSLARIAKILRDLDLSNDAAEEEEDEEERLLRLLGNIKERVAAAPRVNREQNPTAGSVEEIEANEGSAASAEIVSRLSSSSPFSTADLISQSVTRMAVEAARSLPVAEGALARRASSPDADNKKRVLNPEAESSSRSADREPIDAAPRVSAEVAIAEPSVNTENRVDSSEDATSEAEVKIARTENTASDASIALEVDAIDGPVGLSTTPDVTAGVNRRPASEQSKQLQPELDTRFRKEDFGGAPAMNPTATIAKEAFRQRTPGSAQRTGEPKTEAAIQQGLEFLIRHQLPDGSWSLNRFDTEHPLHKRQLDSDMAATALAVLSFQGAGYNHLEFKYARQVNHAIRWLIKNQGDDGLLYLESDQSSNNACRLYSHGIASLALTEAYGMTQDPMLREPAQKALNFIAESQHPNKGGWRYFSEMKKRSSDTSVSGWMVMALQSGRLSGLDVADSTFESLAGWLAVAADPANESLYRYNPYAVNSPGVSRINGRNASPSMTAVGLLMRIYSGWEKDDPRLISGANYLVDQQLPGETLKLRDTYYWYYATQVLKHVGGPQWQKWNDALRPMLIRTQEKSGDNAGSWDPFAPVPDRWAPFGGRLYVTTMNLLSLEVRHRLLPLYKKTNSADEPPSVPNAVIEVEGLVE